MCVVDRHAMTNDASIAMAMVMNHRHCVQLAAFVLFSLGDSV
jgi:hypothetical protein